MDFPGRRHRDRSARLVGLIFFILFSLSLFSQESELSNSDEIKAIIEISPSKIIVGQRFDITIFADFTSYRNVNIIEPKLPHGISLVSGPYKSAQTINIGDSENQQYIKKTRIYYKYKVNKPGLFSLGEFVLSDGSETIRTEPIMFPVMAYDERELNFPIFARWSEIPEQIFIGETIPIILEMENLEELSFPERIIMTAPRDGMFEKVDSLGEISVTEIAGHEVYIAPVESWLFTPTMIGSLTIPAAKVQYGKINRSTKAINITINEIPQEISASGAIGVFEVQTVMENLPLKKGKTSILRIRVEGEGNLSYLQMPQPEFKGLTIIEKEENSSFKATIKGYNGYREDLYRISIAGDLDLSIVLTDWLWYNKEAYRIESEKLENYFFENKSSSEYTKNLSISDDFPLFNSWEIVKFRNSFYYIYYYYFLALPGFILILIVLIKRKVDARLFGISLILIFLTSSTTLGQKKILPILQKAEMLIEQKDNTNALILYDDIIKKYGDNGAIFYNKALLNYDLKNIDGTIYNLRKALSLKPGNRTFLNLLRLIEAEFELDHQVSSTLGISPDLFFVLFIIFINGASFLIAYNIIHKKIQLSIASFMLFFLAFISLGSIFYTHRVMKRETAVILSSGGELKKVPGLMGASWLTLPEGTAVFIKSESDDSLLIQTGYGLEGWIDKESLTRVQGFE